MPRQERIVDTGPLTSKRGISWVCINCPLLNERGYRSDNGPKCTAIGIKICNEEMGTTRAHLEDSFGKGKTLGGESARLVRDTGSKDPLEVKRKGNG